MIAANDAFLQRTGRYREQVLGCCCRDLGPGMCTMSGLPHPVAAWQSGERQVRICERRAPDGNVRVGGGARLADPNDAGELVQVVEVWRDISDRRAAEARLAESHRLASLGMLASGFSHELNTPLATVLTCVEGILRDAKQASSDAPDAVRAADNAAIAREQVLRCRGITQHFLRLSRGQPSPGDMVDLQRTIAAVARLIEPTARAHTVTIDVRPAPPGLHVRADEAESAARAHQPAAERDPGLRAGRPGRPGRGRRRAGSHPRHRRRLRHRARGSEAHLRAVLQPAEGRHRPRPVPVAELRPPLGRRHPSSRAPGPGSTFEVVLPPAAALEARSA